MKRRGWRAVWLGLLIGMLTLLPGQAGAHVVNIMGKVNLVGSELKVSFLDPYNVPLEQLVVKASVEEIGGKPGRTVTLKEGAPGVYAGALSTPPTNKYQVTLSFDMAGDMHQALLTAEKGKDQAEVMLPVLGIGATQESSRTLWLFGGAILVLAGATAFALYRTPKDSDEEADV
ncbi:MAG TPA: hypothetical protein VK191_02990 [Symbiobacteriaceae bacterium]|nr:hypothetical protein [Symbiobacteriaceae bacterium]